MSIGIDIGKDTFYIVAFDPDGQLDLRKQIKRLAQVSTLKKLLRCVVGHDFNFHPFLIGHRFAFRDLEAH